MLSSRSGTSCILVIGILIICSSLSIAVHAESSSYFFNEPQPPPTGASYPARIGHAMISCDGGAHIIGGGGDGPSSYNEIRTLTFNETIGVDQWTTTIPTTPAATARELFGAVALPDGTVIVTGGYNVKSVTYTNLNDVWMNSQCVNSSTWQQLSNTGFPSRNGFSLVYFQGSAVMLGGAISRISIETSEVYSLAYDENLRTFASGNWTSYGEAPWPGRRLLSTVVYNQKIFIFGGEIFHSQNSQYFNDVWTLSSLGATWTQLSADGSIGRFSRRSAGVAALWQNEIIYTTGENSTSVYLQDVWSYSSTTQQWSLINSTQLMPVRQHAAMVNHQGRLILTGGTNSNLLGDIWVSKYQQNVSAVSSSSSTGSSISSSSSSTASSSSSGPDGDHNSTASLFSFRRSDMFILLSLIVSAVCLFH